VAVRPPVGTPTLSRRTRILLITAGVLLVVLLGGSRLIQFYVDWLWFGEVGYQGVFTTVLLTRVVQFVLGAVLLGGAVALVLWLAYRSRPVFVPVSGPEDPVARYRTVVIGRLRLFAIGIPVIVGLIAGLAAQGDWQTTQLFLNSTDFGVTDPEFGTDVAFYAFQLPFYRWILDWLFVTIAICFIAALIMHYLFGGIRFAGRSGQVSTAARAQLAILAGSFVLLKAFAYFLDRYELLSSQRSPNFTGATYTDLNAVLPAKLILLFISIICAAAFFVAVFRRNLQLPGIALVLLVLSSILIGAAWPAVLEQFVVKPNANEREAVPISRNIDATRQAYGLTDSTVSIKPYEAKPTSTPAEVLADTATVPNIRLLDPSKLAKTFTQLQQRKNFYGFPEKLDIDRYVVNGHKQDYVVAAREINTAQLTGNQRDWINQRLVYTHGNGFVAAPANQVDAVLRDTGGTGGYPKFTVSDTSTKGEIPLNEPRIYYGELFADPDYSIVGSNGNADREYDSDTSSTTYQGKGGVDLGNVFNRLVFALSYGERNILFNSSIGENSKIMYIRDPRERVQNVAPWLTLDGDPYPAVVDGRMTWIVDGYTTAQNYPYAEKTALGNATRDTLPGVQRLPNKEVSYLRNSVKATVDAYDGTVSLYAFDEKDPVLQTWMKAFPGVVKPGNQISASLRSHFRYPEDQFKVQRELLTKYHVTSPGEFFSTVSFWDVPSDPTVTGGAGTTPADAQPPYYLMAGLPGQQGATFQLTSALVQLRREFLSAYVSASSEPENYGKITVLQLPADTQTPGPQQVQTQFVSSPDVSREINILRQSQTNVEYGNLLTLPVGGGLLFVEPVYIERAGQQSTFPQLARVLVSYGGKVGYAATLEDALKQVFGNVAPAPATGTPGAPQAGGSAGELQAAVAAINSALTNLRAAQASGDFAAQGRALADLDTAVKRFQAASAAANAASAAPATPAPTTPAPTPAPGGG
jgi:uncharacterized membrane protein (UPF0182 family)